MATTWPGQAQRAGDLQLLLGRHPGHDDPVAVEGGSELAPLGGEVGSHEDGPFGTADPHLAGDRGRRLRVVARDHRDLDAGVAHGGDRRGRVRARGVLEADQPEQLQAVLGDIGARGQRPGLGEVAGGHREHAQAPGREIIERPLGRAGLLGRSQAPGEHGVGGALDEHPSCGHQRHPPTARVEREAPVRTQRVGVRRPLGAEAARERVDRGLHGVALGDPSPVALDGPPRRAQHRGHGQVAQRLQQFGVRVHVGLGAVPAPADPGNAAGRPDLDHRHLVLGQGPGLVRADEGRRAQRLDRLQPADQGMAARHPLRPEGQRQRHGGQQPLRDQRDGHADGEDEQYVL